MSKWGVRKKIILFSFLQTVLIFLIGQVGYVSSTKIEHQYSSLINKNVPSLEFSNEMFLYYSQTRIALRTLGLARIDQGAATRAIKNVQESILRFEKSDSEYLKFGFYNPQQKLLYEKARETWEEFRKVSENVLTIYLSQKQSDQNRLSEIFLQICPQKAEEFKVAIEALSNFHRRDIALKARFASNASSTAVKIEWYLVLIAAVISIGLGATFMASITSELSSISKELIINSDTVSSDAHAITESSSSLLKSFLGQLTSLEQISVTIKGIQVMVNKNHEKFKDAVNFSSFSRNEANIGMRSATDVLEAINEINSINLKFQDVIQSSNKNFSEVYKLIQEVTLETKVINEIAFQIKLLSFNTSTEAAHIGEKGKSLAVIAEEIGKLARISENASNEISTLLSDSASKINMITRENLQKTDEIIKMASCKVEYGVQVGKESVATLEKNVKNADRLSINLEDVLLTSEKQTLRINEITSSLISISDNVQEDSEQLQISSKIATSLEIQVRSLNLISDRLKKLVYGHE